MGAAECPQSRPFYSCAEDGLGSSPTSGNSPKFTAAKSPGVDGLCLWKAEGEGFSGGVVPTCLHLLHPILVV